MIKNEGRKAVKKYLVILGIIGMVLVATNPAHAIILYDSRSTWELAVGSFSSVDIASQVPEYATLSAGSPLLLPYGGESVAFDVGLTGYQVPGSWGTWSGGNTPAVLASWEETSPGQWAWYSSVTGTFSSPIGAFGLEMEPNVWDTFSMTLYLSDGSSKTLDVAGESGAQFFGWSDGEVTAMTLSTSEDALGFAFGRMVMGQPIPEPMSLLLLTSGLIGCATIKRRRS